MRLGAGIPLFQPSPARPVWTHPKAVWACDFAGARHALDGRMRDLSALVTVTRSSPHLLTDAQGIVRSFPANTLASTIDVGAYAGGQTVNLLHASTAFTTPGYWAGYNSPAIADNAVLAPDGTMTGASFSGMAGGGYLLTQNLNVTAGQKYTLAVWMRGAAGGEKVRIDLKNVASTGVPGTLFTLTSGWKRYSVTLTADATASRGFQFRVESGFGNPDFTFFIWNAQVEASGFASPDIVSPVNTQGVRLASDVRAVSMDWFSATRLDAGHTILAEVDLTHVGDGVTRHIMTMGVGVSTNIRRVMLSSAGLISSQVYNTTTGQATLLQLTGAVATGRQRIAVRMQPGAHRLAATGRSAVASVDATPLENLEQLHIGQNYTGSADGLNDTIRRLEICHPLTDVEMDAWVAA